VVKYGHSYIYNPLLNLFGHPFKLSNEGNETNTILSTESGIPSKSTIFLHLINYINPTLSGIPLNEVNILQFSI